MRFLLLLLAVVAVAAAIGDRIAGTGGLVAGVIGAVLSAALMIVLTALG